jgi:hypothetical protein
MRDIPELHVLVTTETKTTIVDSVKPQIADHPSVNTHSFIHSFLYFLITQITMKYVIKVHNFTITNNSNIYSI